MKKIVNLLLASFFVAGITVSSYAKGPFITPGARAAGYGTAFVSVADDLTAVYYNPAGLAYQKDTQVMLSAFYVSSSATSDDTSGQPTKYETSAVVPFFGFSTSFYSESTLALSVYSIGGGGGKVAGLPSGLKIEGEQSFMVYNISLAKEVLDKVSVGIGFDAIEMKDKLVMKVPYSFIGLPYPGLTNIDYNRSAFGFQGNIGVMYKPVEKLSTGFLLRSGTYIGLPEEQITSNPSTGTGYTYPMTMELGASYNIFDPLTVALAFSYNKYSWSSSLYRDTVQIRVGSEYKATEKLSLHLGYFTDPSIYKDAVTSATITNIDMYDMNYLSAGAEYSFTQALKLGLTYTHSFTHDVCKNGVTYEYPNDLVRFDVSYKFL